MTYVAETFGPQGWGNYFVDWSSGQPMFEPVNRAASILLIPGFVDLHLHGAFGLDFMDASRQDMLVLAQKLEDCGYEAFLPTTVTASAQAVLQAVANLPEDDRIPGFHLEGPFISPAFPGAQPKEFIALPPQGPSEWDAVLDHPKLKRVTLAPEIPGALDLILRLTKRGVAVSMGHTNATFEEARRGFEFGATDTTHTFNAMRPLHHREAGTVGYALANDALSCELIYDRLHVCFEAAKLLVKCKPADRVIAVSDSTRATGLPLNTRVSMWGHEAVTGRGDVRLTDGTLAGSAITLLDAFRNLADDFGAEFATRVCCINPRKSLGWTSDPPSVWLEFTPKLQYTGRRTFRA